MATQKETLRRPDVDRLVDYKPALLANHLLDTLGQANRYLAPEMLRAITHETKELDEGAIQTAMIRQIDESGDIGKLLGTCKNSTETSHRLRALGQAQLAEIGTLDKDVQQEVFEALKGMPATLRAILILDERQKAVVEQLNQLRDQSDLAKDVWGANLQALRALYRDPSQLTSVVFDQFIPKEDRWIFQQGVPRIYYATEIDGDRVKSVKRLFYYPNIWNVHLGEEYRHQSVGKLLYDITPKYFIHTKFRRGLDVENEPRDFMIQLGIVGDPLARVIIKKINTDTDLKARIMEQEAHEKKIKERIIEMP